LDFVLNKTLVSGLQVEADSTVLEMLRSRGLRGTKEGCASGDCGACTVMVGELDDHDQINYKTVNACIALTGSLAGKHLVTVEGLAKDEKLHPVQQAMVDNHGSQCGFCTPGFVMSLANLVQDQSAAPSTKINHRETVMSGISGNLCRCTGYKPIVNAGVDALERAEATSVYDEETVASLKSMAASQTSGQYHRPLDLEELDRLVTEYGQQCIVAGATDFALEITQRWKKYERLIDVTQVHELQKVVESPTELIIGAAVNYTMLEKLFKAESEPFVKLLERLGSRQIRNSGTLGGNLGTASPIADTPPALIACNALIELRNSKGKTRETRVEDFYTGYRQTILADDEYIYQIRIPRDSLQGFHRFYKHSKRLEDDISSVLGAFAFSGSSVKLESPRISYGGMAATPVRVAAVEKLIEGRSVDEDLMQEAGELLRSELQPMSDVRASATFRMDMAAEMLDRALKEFSGLSLPRVEDL
jgi:xanthine dehydrogenase small subunit